MFFDDYPKFYETSETAATARRLNLRHMAMIEANRDILAGARVLDLASHDGRWSFAALQAGAAHVTGVEARRSLVDNARKTFADYGVDSDRYRFVRGDMFRVLERQEFDVDVVMCFGFIYHTLRYGELFRGIANTKPRHCIIDTKVITDDKPLVWVNVNRTGVQSHAARDALSNRRRAIAGWPSVPALELMMGVYGLQVEDRYDWPALLEQWPDAQRNCGDYRTGRRVTLRCTWEGEPSAEAAADAAAAEEDELEALEALEGLETGVGAENR